MMSSSATPSEKEIRILIADDHPIVCEGLIAVFALEDDLKVVGHAHDGEEACLLCKQLCHDILILDLRMPKKDGIEVVIELMPQKPGPGIIVLTHSAKEEDLRRALGRGSERRRDGMCCNFVVEPKDGVDDRKVSSSQRTDRE